MPVELSYDRRLLHSLEDHLLPSAATHIRIGKMLHQLARLILQLHHHPRSHQFGRKRVALPCNPKLHTALPLQVALLRLRPKHLKISAANLASSASLAHDLQLPLRVLLAPALASVKAVRRSWARPRPVVGLDWHPGPPIIGRLRRLAPTASSTTSSARDLQSVERESGRSLGPSQRSGEEPAQEPSSFIHPLAATTARAPPTRVVALTDIPGHWRPRPWPLLGSATAPRPPHLDLLVPNHQTLPSSHRASCQRSHSRTA